MFSVIVILLIYSRKWLNALRLLHPTMHAENLLDNIPAPLSITLKISTNLGIKNHETNF